jgi:hypothetical protein
MPHADSNTVRDHDTRCSCQDELSDSISSSLVKDLAIYIDWTGRRLFQHEAHWMPT